MSKRGRGRPPKYESPEVMQSVIDAYFASCQGHYRTDETGAFVLDRNGRPILDGAMPITMTGLQYALGFQSRQSLTDYRRRGPFADILSRARLRVEAYCEERLFDRDGYSGAAFVLKTCFAWGDESKPEEKAVPVVKFVSMDA